MSYSVVLNSNSSDAVNLTATRNLLNNLVDAYHTDHAKIAGLQYDINDIDRLARWTDKLVKLMNVVGSTEDVILEPQLD
jgi:ribosomal protein S15P/S13E